MALIYLILTSAAAAAPGAPASWNEVADELVQCTRRLEEAVQVHRSRLPYWLVTADSDVRAVVLGLEMRKRTTLSLVEQFREERPGGAGGHLLANGLDDCRKTLSRFKADSLHFALLCWGGMGLAGILTLGVLLAMVLPSRFRRSRDAAKKSFPATRPEDPSSDSTSSSMRL